MIQKEGSTGLFSCISNGNSIVVIILINKSGDLPIFIQLSTNKARMQACTCNSESLYLTFSRLQLKSQQQLIVYIIKGPIGWSIRKTNHSSFVNYIQAIIYLFIVSSQDSSQPHKNHPRMFDFTFLRMNFKIRNLDFITQNILIILGSKI